MPHLLLLQARSGGTPSELPGGYYTALYRVLCEASTDPQLSAHQHCALLLNLVHKSLLLDADTNRIQVLLVSLRSFISMKYSIMEIRHQNLPSNIEIWISN